AYSTRLKFIDPSAFFRKSTKAGVSHPAFLPIVPVILPSLHAPFGSPLQKTYTMKTIFVTGASGYIGGSVAVQLVKKGYRVLGLHRNNTQEKALAALGIEPVAGSLDEVRRIEGYIERADAVVNT